MVVVVVVVLEVVCPIVSVAKSEVKTRAAAVATTRIVFVVVGWGENRRKCLF